MMEKVLVLLAGSCFCCKHGWAPGNTCFDHFSLGCSRERVPQGKGDSHYLTPDSRTGGTGSRELKAP